MDFTDSQFTQLILGLAIGLVLFVAAYAASEKSVVTILIVTLPFQPITSGYGTLNTVIIYMVALVFILRGRLKHYPLIVPAMLILMTLLLSTSQAHRSTYFDHFFYIVGILANFLLFYIVYNYFIKSRTNPQYGINVLLACGFFVLLLSTVKLVFNFDPGVVLGIDELALAENRHDNTRFIGVFGAAGINAAFHASQLMIIAFAFIVDRRNMARFLLMILFLGNAAFLVATGSRGGFLAGAIGLILLLFVFVRQIGVGRAITLGVVLPVLFASASIIMIKFTDHNVLFDRLLKTEFKGYTPDTRDFSVAIERIPEAMVFGHGPRQVLLHQETRRVPGLKPMAYSHNLYLHILYTTGMVGMLAWLTWFLALALRFLRPLKVRGKSALLNGAPRMAIVLLFAFLVDELKIEFLRFSLSDYQQYMFAVWAVLLALSDRAYAEGRKAQALARLEKLA